MYSYLLIISSILILILIFQISFTNEFKECFCTNYVDVKRKNPNYKKVYRMRIPAFNKNIRKKFINEAEKHAKKHTWTTKRHESYATTDIPVDDIKSIKNYINTNIKKEIFPIFSEISGIKANNFTINDAFIVRYKEGEQVDLKRHQDGSTFSFTMLLNDPSEFSGGGTFFYNGDGLIKPTNDEVIIHCGLIYHEGRKITRGKRYLLVGFCYAKNDCDA